MKVRGREGREEDKGKEGNEPVNQAKAFELGVSAGVEL